MLTSCESLIYNDYTIIDIGKSKSAKSNKNKIENTILFLLVTIYILYQENLKYLFKI